MKTWEKWSRGGGFDLLIDSKFSATVWRALGVAETWHWRVFATADEAEISGSISTSDAAMGCVERLLPVQEA